MQDNVEIYTKALIRVIQDSKEYRAFCRAKNKLSGMPELKKQIDEYRAQTYRLQYEGDAETLYDRVQEFNTKHAQFRKDPLVNEYLKSELAVCRMLQKVAAGLSEALDLDLDGVAQEIRS